MIYIRVSHDWVRLWKRYFIAMLAKIKNVMFGPIQFFDMMMNMIFKLYQFGSKAKSPEQKSEKTKTIKGTILLNSLISNLSLN